MSLFCAWYEKWPKRDQKQRGQCMVPADGWHTITRIFGGLLALWMVRFGAYGMEVALGLVSTCGTILPLEETRITCGPYTRFKKRPPSPLLISSFNSNPTACS